MGRYQYNIGGIALVANDDQVKSSQTFTWDDFSFALQLMGYCGPGKGIFRESEIQVFKKDQWVGNIDVRLIEGSGEN